MRSHVLIMASTLTEGRAYRLDVDRARMDRAARAARVQGTGYWQRNSHGVRRRKGVQ